jgi:hypothetical protein
MESNHSLKSDPQKPGYSHSRNLKFEVISEIVVLKTKCLQQDDARIYFEMAGFRVSAWL